MADWIKYAQAKTHNFTLYAPDGIEPIVGVAFAAGDILIATNGGGDVNATNLPVAYGSGYSMAITAAETTGAKVRLTMIDQAATKKWLSNVHYFETYGDPLAEHAFDLDTASVPQTADHAASIAQIFNDTGDMRPKLGVPAAGSISADIATRSTFNAATDTVSNVQNIINNVNAMVQGYITTAVTEATLGMVANNFNTFYENANALTSKVVDDVGGSGVAADPWLTILPGAYTVGQAGKIVGDNIDSPISPLSLEATVATVKAETALIKSDTASTLADTTDIQARIPLTLTNGKMESNIGAINNNAVAAFNLALSAMGLTPGLCVGVPTFTTIPTDITVFAGDGIPIGRQLFINSGAANGTTTDITGWDLATKTLTVTAIPIAPAANDSIIIS